MEAFQRFISEQVDKLPLQLLLHCNNQLPLSSELQAPDMIS